MREIIVNRIKELLEHDVNSLRELMGDFCEQMEFEPIVEFDELYNLNNEELLEAFEFIVSFSG